MKTLTLKVVRGRLIFESIMYGFTALDFKTLNPPAAETACDGFYTSQNKNYSILCFIHQIKEA